MKRKLGSLLVATLAIAAPRWAAAEELTIRGGGTTRPYEFFECENHQPASESISVNATLHEDGSASGKIKWSVVWNCFYPPGPGVSGFPVQLEAESWLKLFSFPGDPALYL